MTSLPGIRITLTALLFLSSPFLTAQEKVTKEFSRAVQEAEIALNYDEDYARAAGLFESLLKTNSDNSNLKAKLGICYLNMEGRKKDALKYLIAASSDVVKQVKDYIETGVKAPDDTYMYLALAYQMNDSLEKAISLYGKMIQKLGNTDVFRKQYLEKQIRNCNYAVEMKKKPLIISSQLFTPWLIRFPGACNPVISANDSVFVFTQKAEGKTRVFCSYRKGDWGQPVEITRQLGGYSNMYANSITGNGRFLLLGMDDGGDGNLYFSERKDTTWTRVKGMGKNINTIYWESFGFITKDGRRLFFSSNRPGGSGQLDIWSSARNADGSWNQAQNLGQTINTAYNEDTPFFDQESGILTFSSAGHTVMGGYDVFRSAVRENKWSEPAGIPYAFNTTTDNIFFVPGNNQSVFITSLYSDQQKANNIFTLTSKDPAESITRAEVMISLSDGLKPDPANVKITLTNLSSSASSSVVADGDGIFHFDVRPGDYRLEIVYSGYKTDTRTISIPLYYTSQLMLIECDLVPYEVTSGKFISISNILFDFNSSALNPVAISRLEELKAALIANPNLKVEMAGYTDAIGTNEYNLTLAGKRNKAIIDYLTSASIPASRFVSKALGETDFVAVNVNEDGTDNPENRKYNRRVEFGIVDPSKEVTLTQETYTPELLRLPSSMKYSVVLIRSPKKLLPEVFNKLSLGGKLFLRSIESDTVSVYAAGVFYNHPDAVNYLGYVRENGFRDAYLVNQYDLNDEAKILSRRNIIVSLASGKKIYTIQIASSKTQLNMDIFRDLKDVKEILDDEGYYRYVVGEYSSVAKAQEDLKPVLDAGFADAIVRELNSLIVK